MFTTFTTLFLHAKVLLVSIKHKVQLKQMGVCLVLKVFGHEPKDWRDKSIFGMSLPLNDSN